MDMFEAVELHIPEITFQIELSTERMSLDDALQQHDAEERLGKEYTKWHRRVMGQVDSARQLSLWRCLPPHDGSQTCQARSQSEGQARRLTPKPRATRTIRDSTAPPQPG
jgi:hypothetical protein